MMQAVREMILRLMAVMVFSGMMELLLPEGSTRSLVRLVMGFSVLAACLKPAVEWLEGWL